MIRILTGPIRNYKTTTLLQWALHRNDVGGVLTPDCGEWRCLYNVKEKFSIPWQKESIDAPTDVQIGRFIFDQLAFDTAITWLNQHLIDPSINKIILDEIGPLELKGKGWHDWLHSALLKLKDKELILVVRESIVNDVISHFEMNDVHVVEKEFFA